MTDEVRRLMNTEPFAPFFATAQEGKRYRVMHPDDVAISPRGSRNSLCDDGEMMTTPGALHIIAAKRLSTRSRCR